MATFSSSSKPENQNLSEEEFQALLQANARFKSRSHETYTETHFPELTAEPKPPIATVLIGDSMLERLKTTGASTKTANLPSSFNAGVGGDKIENVLYRLNLGMAELLKGRGVRLWVVMVGTNNLTPKKGFRSQEILKYRLLLQALLRIAPESRALCCVVFRRKDVDDGIVERSNKFVKEMIEETNGNLGEPQTVFWLDAPEGITKERLEDHVHLDEEGYRIWDEVLFARIEELLQNRLSLVQDLVHPRIYSNLWLVISMPIL